MKVTQDLRVAIGAVSRQIRETARNWSERNRLNRQAAEALDKKKRGAISKLAAKIADLEAQEAKLRDDLRAYGVGRDDSGIYIQHEPTFVKVGGILPEAEKRQWKPDEVIAKLGAAKTEKEFNAILAEYGINWN